MQKCLAWARTLAHSFVVKIETPFPSFKVVETGEPKESGYAARKLAKTERGLEQSKDRSNLISAQVVWRELGLEA